MRPGRAGSIGRSAVAENARIIISGFRAADGQREEVEMTAEGSYHKKDGRHYIFYEAAEDLGQGAVRNMIKASPDCLEIVRKGDIDSRMVFCPGEKTKSSYVIPGGRLELGVCTQGLQVCEAGALLEIQVEYSLDINGGHVSDNRLKIEIRRQC